jgi:hypothetical protein
MDIDSSDDEGDNPSVQELMQQRVREQAQHRQEQQQLLSMLQVLEARINAQQALGGPPQGADPTAPGNNANAQGEQIAVNNGHSTVKVPKPDLFYGDRSKYEEWTIQVELHFRFNRVPLNEQALYAATFLRGRAEKWIKPFLKKKLEGTETTGILNSWTSFKENCTNIFGNTMEIMDATREIQRLRQTGSVRDYTAKFQECAAVLGWGDTALFEMYRKGLRDDVEDELMRYGGNVTNLLVETQNFPLILFSIHCPEQSLEQLLLQEVDP